MESTEIVDDIEALLVARPAIDDVHSVQSQWVGPDAFSYKCEVDFDGTWIAAQLFDKRVRRVPPAGRSDRGSSSRLEPRRRREAPEDPLARYEPRFKRAQRALDDELPTLLSFYAEDVMRAVLFPAPTSRVFGRRGAPPKR